MAKFSKKYAKSKNFLRADKNPYAQLGAEWKALEKHFDKAGKRAPFMMKSVLGLSLTPMKREVKKQLPKRGRGWKGKYGIQSGILKKQVDKVVRPVKKSDNYAWGAVGVKEGVFPYRPGNHKRDKKYESLRGVGQLKNKKRKRKKRRVHIPWNIDHLIEFGFIHNKSGRFIPPFPFLRKGRDKSLPAVKKVMEDQTKKKVFDFFTKRKKSTKAPFRSS